MSDLALLQHLTWLLLAPIDKFARQCALTSQKQCCSAWWLSCMHSVVALNPHQKLISATRWPDQSILVCRYAVQCKPCMPASPHWLTETSSPTMCSCSATNSHSKRQATMMMMKRLSHCMQSGLLLSRAATMPC